MVKKTLKNKRKCSFLDELKDNRGYVECQNNNIIKKILEICKNTIKQANNLRVTNSIIDVPLFIIGEPLYDIILVSVGVNNELKKLGLKTMYIKPNKIYIKW